jgi:hypothetical protein
MYTVIFQIVDEKGRGDGRDEGFSRVLRSPDRSGILEVGVVEPYIRKPSAYNGDNGLG